ncbi:MAG TPA: hypothetical protein VIV12_29060, partial [Streptosporangiaceae bacterium]
AGQLASSRWWGTVATSRGPVERATRRDVKGLGDLTGIQRSLAETAYRLAKTLDDGAGLATAAVARELRATLLTLRESSDGSAAGRELLARLSTPVHDAEVPAGDARRQGGDGGGDAGDAADALAAARRRRRA